MGYAGTLNERERFIETLSFGTPDRIPFVPGGPRQSTLAAWQRQGLQEPSNWYGELCAAIGLPIPSFKPRTTPGVNFRMIPTFEEKILEHTPGSSEGHGHYIMQDWMGNVIEISDAYDATYIRNAIDFVTRRWIRFPVTDEADFEAMKRRYDPHDPARYPDDFSERVQALRNRDYPCEITVNGPFWQLREWCGFEPLCALFLENPAFVEAMIAFWSDFVVTALEPLLDAGVLDNLWVSEDMAFKAHPMISPEMTARYIAPVYARWSRLCRDAGVPLFSLDSDGCVDLLIPIWIDHGVNVSGPNEVAAGCDLNAYRARFGRSMAYTGGIDKRAIAAGGSVIEGELARLTPLIRDGGYLPSCDHGVPPDISWPNYVRYGRLLAELTGWI